MDKKNKILIWIFALLLLGSVTTAFLRYFIFLDYTIKAEIDCDPEVDSCYVYICNPKEEECTGDPEEDTWYYKVIYKKAFNFLQCDPNEDENCVIDCYLGEEDCEIELCDATDPVNGQECMTPEKYLELYGTEEAEGEGEEEVIESQEVESEEMTHVENGENPVPVGEEGNEEINNTEGEMAPVGNSIHPAVPPVPANSEIPSAE